MDTRQDIAELLDKVEARHDHDTLELKWNGTKQRAAELARAIGEDPEVIQTFLSEECTSCQLRILNAMRLHIDRPALYNAVTETEYQARISTCAGDGIRPRCEHLSDGFTLKPTFPFVEFKNANCKACGCFVHLKAAMTFFDCPLHKWPKAA